MLGVSTSMLIPRREATGSIVVDIAFRSGMVGTLLPASVKRSGPITKYIKIYITVITGPNHRDKKDKCIQMLFVFLITMKY